MANIFKAKTLVSRTGIFSHQAIAPNLVYNTGNQTISGNKSFYGDVLLSGNNNRIGKYHYIETSDDYVFIKDQYNDLILSSEEYILFYDQVGSVSWGGRTLNDSLGQDALNWDNRNLINKNGSPVLYWTGDNIGIGTNTPTEKLQVDGNIIANNLVYNTGNQNISGVKTFAENAVFGDPSQGDFLVISGNTFTVYGSGNFINGLFVSGVAVLTGVDLSSSATVVNLFATGSTLNNKINSLSGVSVLTFGNQIISGDKTFLNNIKVSGSGIFNALDLNNIDTLNFSGVDISITNGSVNLTNRPTVNSSGVALIGELVNTGSKLDNKINSLSGVSVLTFGNQTINGNKTFIGATTLSGTDGGFIGGEITLVGGSGVGFGGGINLNGGIGGFGGKGTISVIGQISINRSENTNNSTAFYKSGDSGTPYLNITKDQINITNGATLLVSGVAVTPTLYATSTNLASTGSNLNTQIENTKKLAIAYAIAL